jgi:anti-sigma B factor antagonist
VEVTESGIHIVRLMQIFDAASVNEFEKVLAYLMARGHFKLVVDLTNVEFVASAGWGALTAEFRRVRDNGGDIRLAGMNPDVLDVFFLLELDSFMSTYDTLDAALSSFEIEQSQSPVPEDEHPEAPVFETMMAPETDVVEGESAVQEEPVVHMPPAKKETKKKRGHRAAAPVLSETAVDSRAIYEVSASLDPAEVSPEPHGKEETAWPEDDDAMMMAPEMTLPPVGTEIAATEEESSTFGEEAVSAGRNDAQEESAEITLGESRYIPAKKKPQERSRPPKDKSLRRFPRKQTEAPAAVNTLPVEGQVRHDSAAAAPPLRLQKNETAKDPARLAENRSNATPAAPEAGKSSFEARKEPAHDEFEMQDIHDPWLVDEIDTLPEEFEMDEGSWQGSTGLDDIERNASFSETAGPQQTDPNESFDLPAHGENEKAPRRMISSVAQAAPKAFTAGQDTSPTPSGERKAFVNKASAPKTKRSSPKPTSSSAPANAPTAIAVENFPNARPESTFGQLSGTVQARSGVRPQPVQKNANIIKVSSEGDCIELVRQIVKEHPQYGPTMIGKFFETRVDPPVKASRSTIYRWLRLAGLNTRDQRAGFAGQPEPVSSIGTKQNDILDPET